MDRLERNPPFEGELRTLRDNARSGRGPATAPRAPVATGADEVPMRRDGLRVRGIAVTEQLPLVRAHLEEPEVLPVLCRRGEVGLAPGDRDRLLAVVAEDRTDRCFRREDASRRAPRACTFARRTATVAVNWCTRRLAYVSAEIAFRCRADALRSVRWVSKKWTVPRYFRSAATLRSSCSSRVNACRVVCVFRTGADGACIAAAAACVTRTNASRPTSRTLKRLPPGRGQGRDPHGTARVARS